MPVENLIGRLLKDQEKLAYVHMDTTCFLNYFQSAEEKEQRERKGLTSECT